MEFKQHKSATRLVPENAKAPHYLCGLTPNYLEPLMQEIRQAYGRDWFTREPDKTGLALYSRSRVKSLDTETPTNLEPTLIGIRALRLLW